MWTLDVTRQHVFSSEVIDSSPHLEELHSGGGGVDEHHAQAARSFQPVVGAIPAKEREHQRLYSIKYMYWKLIEMYCYPDHVLR